jgi:lysophospholipase L1-like esterase
MNIVVFGTSLLWGQGLPDEDKIHSVLARMLQHRHPDREVNMTFLAHSGASTGYNPDGSVDTRRKPRIHGEIPTEYPTILQEMEEFDALNITPESIDVVLLDAGINDVHVTNILDPFITPNHIAKDVEIYCDQHMRMLVDTLLKKFPNAKIVLAAYYEFITEESEKAYVRTMVKALGKFPVGFIANFFLKRVSGLIKRRLLTNCDTFSDQSYAAFKQVAQDMNKSLPAPRVFVARPDIKTENAAFASQPWLWGIKADLSPQDPVAPIRAAACQTEGKGRMMPVFCEIASVGHPNLKGAKAYAEAIIAFL